MSCRTETYSSSASTCRDLFGAANLAALPLFRRIFAVPDRVNRREIAVPRTHFVHRPSGTCSLPRVCAEDLFTSQEVWT